MQMGNGKPGGEPDGGAPANQPTGSFGRIARLALTTDADRGLVERPLLAPNLELRPLGGNATMLVSESFSSLLEGELYMDLLPLLDGTRTRLALARALADKHPAVTVQTALVSMATKGHIVSAEFTMARAMAAYWCSVGCSPRWAEERLGGARIELIGEADGLARALADMGLAVTSDAPTLSVIATRDYLAEEHAETNRARRQSGVPWMLIKADGIWPLFGPVFRPADEGAPCWACLAHRMRGNREVENFLRTAAGDEAAILPRGTAPPLAGAAFGLAANEIAKWVVLGERVPLHENAITLDTFERGWERHPVLRRPQCSECGDERLHRPDRASLPVHLHSSPKPVANSGGLRSVPPEETVRRYAKLVSPISGVVTELLRTTEAGDDWMHVYWAGSNLALKMNSLRLLRNSLRTKSSGKGSTSQQAQASALCEAVERYSGVFHGDEIRRMARYEEFADGDAIWPNDVMLYSDRQFENAEQINALRMRFNYVPERITPDLPMNWSPVWSLTRGRRRWLPTGLLYYAMPLEHEKIYVGPDSNGCASGNTLEEAILQGFFELVERDAFACWWYNRVQLPTVELDSFGDDYLAGMRDYYRAHNRDAWLLDATHDFRIPVFISVSRRTDKETEDIIFAAGAHTDPRIAAFRAVCELNQYLSAVRDVTPAGEGYLFDDPENMWWWHNAKIKDHPYLSPKPGATPRTLADFPAPPRFDDLRDDVEWCRALVESKGLEFLVLDQTRPDVGMPVAKTIVPGMRHFWSRFAPGRLYDVPVAEGWCAAATPEKDLNPISVFI